MKRASYYAIREAIITGDLEQLKEWVNAGKTSKQRIYTLNSSNDLLLQAAENKQWHIVQWLITDCNQSDSLLDAELDGEEFKDEEGYFDHSNLRAVLIAVRAGNYEMAEWLLQQPANEYSANTIEKLFQESNSDRVFNDNFFKYLFKYTQEKHPKFSKELKPVLMDIMNIHNRKSIVKWLQKF